MKCQIPQISWHSRDPVLSVDFQPMQTDQYRLASGGTDSHVLIWYVTYQENKSINVECASDLYRHNKSVNVVRFSPNGELLASGDDEGAMFIWQLKERELIDLPKDDDIVNKEEWYPIKLLRGHLEDIYDISWSKDGNFLVSASMDNTAIIWDMQKFVKVHIFSDFKGYVQGVSWDPCNQFIASVGSDRTLRIHNINSKKSVCRISKAPWSNSTEKGTFKAKLFYDDTLKSYCRRLTYTPDGELLIVPSGILEKGEKLLNTCYVFSKHAPSKPVISLPTGDKYTIAVRCNPFLYKLRRDPNEVSGKENDVPKPLINLPYRMIFAVAACDSVLMYDTEQLLPFAYVSNIHYTHLTDLTWSPDGLTLVASSTDGYCSFIVFNREEIGEIYVPEEPKEIEAESEQISESIKVEKMDTSLTDVKSTSDVEKDKTPVGSKESVETKSPKVASQTPGKESVTPISKNSNSVESKKSAKKSPKLITIKKFFVTPKTTASASCDKTSETVISKDDVKEKNSEPQIITLSDSPLKKDKLCTSNSSKDDKFPKPEISDSMMIPTSVAEPMDVEEPSTDKSSTVSKTEKKTKCKVRLDFDDKGEPSTVNESPSSKKSSKMSIKNFFMSPKANTPIIEKSIKQESEVVTSTSISIQKEKFASSTKCMVNVGDKSSTVDSKNAKPVNSSDDRAEAMDIDRKLLDLDKRPTKDKVEVNSAVRSNRIINIDENASDGDNTSTFVSGITTNIESKKANENDWKLELSQDEEMVIAPAVPPTKTEVVKSTDTKGTPKRRVAFVTLSSSVSSKNELPK